MKGSYPPFSTHRTRCHLPSGLRSVGFSYRNRRSVGFFDDVRIRNLYGPLQALNGWQVAGLARYTKWNIWLGAALAPGKEICGHPMSRCVLAVEDDTLVNMFTSSELRAAGYEVLTAYDADEAIRILETQGHRSRLHRHQHAGFHGRPQARGGRKTPLASGQNPHHNRKVGAHVRTDACGKYLYSETVRNSGCPQGDTTRALRVRVTLRYVSILVSNFSCAFF